MKLVATNTETGKVLISHSGNLSSESLRQTIQRNFPNAPVSFTAPNQKEKGSFPGVPLVWKGPFGDCGGYANMNREIVFRLIQHGFTIKADIMAGTFETDQMTTCLLRALQNTVVPDDCPMVVGYVPTSSIKNKRRTIFYTMMETQELHEHFVSCCNEYPQEIWVPCSFYKKIFEDNGIRRPIKVIPLGVNHHIYYPRKETLAGLVYEDVLSGKRTSLPEGKNFISVFGWSLRKGPDVLCKAFIRAFSQSDRVNLVIYSRYMRSPGTDAKKHIRESILSYYHKECKQDPPSIFFCSDIIPINIMPLVYSNAYAFVLCSRGEGFGLPVVEAGACGLPVISAYNTAMTEYLDPSTALLVSPEGYGECPELASITEYYKNQSFALYGDDSINQFAEHMKTAYQNEPLVKGLAEKFRTRILEKYTWDVCASSVSERLKNA